MSAKGDRRARDGRAEEGGDAKGDEGAKIITKENNECSVRLVHYKIVLPQLDVAAEYILLGSWGARERGSDGVWDRRSVEVWFRSNRLTSNSLLRGNLPDLLVRINILSRTHSIDQAMARIERSYFSVLTVL